jgi:polyisoprenoid-binding protein YceI
MNDRFRMITPALIPVGLFLAVTSAGAAPTDFAVEPSKSNEVVFTSRATGETFHGRTHEISGQFHFDPEDLSAPVGGKLVVDAKSLDTGIELRNEHMRNDHLHPDVYPTIEFVLEEIVSPPVTSMPDKKPLSLKGRGKFTLHGMTRTIEPDLTTVLDSADSTLQVTARFKVKLQDYNIPRPQFLFLRLAEEQDVEVKFIAHETKEE